MTCFCTNKVCVLFIKVPPKWSFPKEDCNCITFVKNRICRLLNKKPIIKNKTFDTYSGVTTRP